MKTNTLKLLSALIAGAALLASVPAQAGDDWREDRREWRDWRDHDRGHRHGHYKKFRDRERVVIRERIIERRPVVREYRYYDYAPVIAPVPVYAPRYYPREPAITIGFDIPPVVIPLR